MTKPTDEQIGELANKWLKGTIMPEEKEQLDLWYDFPTPDSLDWEGKDRSEKELSARIYKNIINQKTPVRVIPARKRWYIPAAAILFFGLCTVYYYTTPNNSSAYVQAAKKIAPGRNAAILTLASGRKIDLSAIENGTLVDQHGLKIVKTADGRLVYEISNSSALDTASNNFNTIEAPSGGQWTVKLPDGSLVFLNTSSKLSYPTHFQAHERRVRMEGEAYFEISKDKSKPFRVQSRTQVVEVLGTHFNISAYPDDQVIRTTLLEGSVKVMGPRKEVFLVPSQQAQYTLTDLKINAEVDLEEIIAWKKGYFKFNGNLQGIMEKVARWYNVDVQYDFKPDAFLTFSGKISRSRDLSGILQMLAYNGDINFKIEGRRITVTK